MTSWKLSSKPSTHAASECIASLEAADTMNDIVVRRTLAATGEIKAHDALK